MYKKWSTLKKLIWLRMTALGNVIKTVTGTIVTFVTSKAAPLINLTATLTPKQDLHGYDAPWPAGGGKNKYDMGKETQTISDLKFTRNADGSYTTSGTASGNASLIGQDLTIPAGSYICSAITTGSGNVNASVYVNRSWQFSIQTAERSLTLSEDSSVYFVLYVASGQTPNITFYPMIRLATETDATYAPYANLCPISGHTGCNIANVPNLLPLRPEGVKTVDKGVTWEKERDYLVRVKGTATGGTSYSGTVGSTASGVVIDSGTKYLKVTVLGQTNKLFCTALYGGTVIGDITTSTGFAPVQFESDGIKALTWYYGIQNGGSADAIISVSVLDSIDESNTYPITFPALGKNLFDEKYQGISATLTYMPLYVGDGTFTLSTTCPKNSLLSANLFLLSGNVSSGANTNNNGAWDAWARIMPSSGGYVTVAYRNEGNIDPSDYKTILASGSSATTYEPYTNTVYSGTLQVNEDGSGVLTADIVSVTIDGSTISFNGKFGPDATAVPSVVLTIYGLPKAKPVSHCVASNYLKAWTTSVIADANTFNAYDTLVSAHIGDIIGFGTGMTYATLQELLGAANNYVSNNPLDIVYELATPLVYNLTAEQVGQITTLQGTNVIWVDDSDEITVQYLA